MAEQGGGVVCFVKGSGDDVIGRRNKAECRRGVPANTSRLLTC